jgi:predicted deacylase
MAQFTKRLIEVYGRTDGSVVSIPVVDIGEGDKKVFIGVSVHGNEITGQGSVWQLMELLKDEELRCAVRVVNMINPEGVNTNERGIPYRDSDINRLYPGDPKGSPGERLASKVWELAEKYECVIDVHTAGNCMPHILLDPLPEPLKTRTHNFCWASGVTVIEEFPEEEYNKRRLSASLGAVAAKANKLSATLELAGSGNIDWVNANAGFAALSNMLVELGVLRRECARSVVGVPVVNEKGYHREVLRTDYAGFIQYLAEPGSRVEKNGEIGVVRGVYGEIVGHVVSEKQCFVIGVNRSHAVFEGDAVCSVAVR